jgi:glyoxylase I family protein
MTDMHNFVAHHVALSVRDLDTAMEFYGQFGYQLALQWEAKDGSLRIAHLVKSGTLMLELFHYSANDGASRAEREVGNDLAVVGVKHLAFAVPDVRQVHARMLDSGQRVTDIVRGRTCIDYFFVCDPDGNWVEIAEDSRLLDPLSPVTLRESS